MANESLVLVVVADPKPHEVIAGFHGDGPVMNPHADRPESANLLKVQRWVSRICFQQGEATIGNCTAILRKLVITYPVITTGTVLHRSVQRPSRRSRNALSAR